MLIETRMPFSVLKVGSSFIPPDDQYPHYRLKPIHTEAGNDYCLLFYVSETAYLVLAPKTKRYQAVRRLALDMETAPFPVYENVS